MDIYEEIDLVDCPYCGGPALLEEENGWNFYVMCMDCGAHTAGFEYKSDADRADAARKAAHVWNTGKALRGNMTE